MRTTMTINDKLYQALKRRALDSGESVSSLVEDALVGQILEDVADIEEAERRRSEVTISHDELVRQFKAEGLL